MNFIKIYRVTLHSLFLSLPLYFLSVPVFAQSVVDAGAIQQEIEREKKVELPSEKKLDSLPPAPMRSVTGIEITVKKFQFLGNTLIKSERLNDVVKEFSNKAVDFSQLQAAAAAVANLYREEGWVVRVYLPEQEIKDGLVLIQVIEAVLGKTRVEGTMTRLPSENLTPYIDAVQKEKEPLSARALDRVLLILDDLPGATISGVLQPGSGNKETDLILKVEDDSPFVGIISVDNFGAKSTGKVRVVGGLNFMSPLGYGEKLSANYLYTAGSRYLRLGGMLPVGEQGWSIGTNISHMSYQLVGSDFEALEVNGDSNVLGFEARYPLVRSRSKNLYFNTALNFKEFSNESLGVTSRKYGIQKSDFGIVGNLFDDIWGGGVNSFSLTASLGHVDLEDIDIGENEDLNGMFSKVRYSLSRRQKLTNELSLYTNLNGQVTPDHLDSSEQFFLGGAYGVRAYPMYEGGGSIGHALAAELHWKFLPDMNLALFYDYGQVSRCDNVPSYSLSGAGVSYTWWGAAGFTLNATYSRRIGNNPNPTLTGADQDGTMLKNRVWLNGTWNF